MMQLVGGWYENREPYGPGSYGTIFRTTSSGLLWTKRVYDMQPTIG